MKFTWVLVVVIVSGFSMFSCFDPPEYSNTPEIAFENLVFKETPNLSEADSLILFIKFKDGDGDLGLRPSETGCYLMNGDTVCYNAKNFYININDGHFLNYEDKRTKPELGLPDFVQPFNCINWEVVKEDNIVKDTLYFELNENHHNIFIDFLVKQNDGTFVEFDWTKEFSYPNCGISFDGRFPILAKNGDLSQKNPVEGTLRYSLKSTGFKLLFSIKTLKLRVQIQDRLLNKSNVIETPEFQFK